MTLDAILSEVGDEVSRAEEKFPPFNSAHEGWAVIREEVDELWDAVRLNMGDGAGARMEAVQIAAMAIRYLRDVSNQESKP